MSTLVMAAIITPSVYASEWNVMHAYLNSADPGTEDTDQDGTGTIKIIKKDETDQNIVLKNSKFNICSGPETVVDTVTTNENGFAVTKPLPAGKYIVKEISAPRGYHFDNINHVIEVKPGLEVVLISTSNPIRGAIAARIKWDDEEDLDELRPDTITAELKVGNDVIGTVELNSGNNWENQLEDLPYYKDYAEIKYNWELTSSLEGYSFEKRSTFMDDMSGIMRTTLTYKHTPVRYTITYQLNGGTYEGSTEDITEVCKPGEVISIHEKPVREGYEFLYWEGSEYQPGDEYTVTSDHTFTAQWKEISDSGTVEEPDKTDKPDNDGKTDTTVKPDKSGKTDTSVKPGNNGKSDTTQKPGSNAKSNTGVKTGDETHIGLWMAIAIIAAAALAAALIYRKKHREE